MVFYCLHIMDTINNLFFQRCTLKIMLRWFLLPSFDEHTLSCICTWLLFIGTLLKPNFLTIGCHYHRKDVPYSWCFSRYINSTNVTDVDHSWNLTPRKKPTTYCSVWAFGRHICENIIMKKLKISHSRNLSTSKKPAIWYNNKLIQ